MHVYYYRIIGLNYANIIIFQGRQNFDALYDVEEICRTNTGGGLRG